MRSTFTKSALLAALVAAVPASALASTARVEGLGLQPDYIQDYVNVTTYPSTIVRYQNLVYGDLGFKGVSGGDLADFEDNNLNPVLENSARAMGAYLGNLWSGRLGVWGVQMNENATPLSTSFGAPYYNRNRNEAFTVLWGYKFSNLAIGAQINRSFSSIEDETTVSEPYTFSPVGPIVGSATNARQLINEINTALGAVDFNHFGIGGGVSWMWDAMGRQHALDASVQWRSLNLEQSDETAQTSLEDNDNGALAFNARAQLATTDNMYLVPVFNYYTMDIGTEFTDVVTPANNFSFEDKVTGFNVGVSANWVLRDTDVLVIGAGYEHQNIDLEDPTLLGNPGEITYQNTPNVFAALETHPTGWLHVRLGASKPWFNELEISDDVTGEETSIKDAPLQYAVGLGFRIGNKLDIDAVVNQDFPFTGTWAASGTSEVPFTRLSTTYRF
jgi:hypothetical protein